jgi:hypothetical protein
MDVRGAGGRIDIRLRGSGAHSRLLGRRVVFNAMLSLRGLIKEAL